MEEVKVLIAEGLRDVLSLDTTRSARICIGNKARGSSNKCERTYRAKIRALVAKVPGWLFTSYQTAMFFNQPLITEPQYKALLDDFFKSSPKALDAHYKAIVDYKFKMDVPKYKLYIRLGENVDPDRREYIANGIRGMFKSDLSILVDMAITGKQIAASVTLF